MGAYKAWFCDLQFGLDKGGSKGMRSAPVSYTHLTLPTKA